MDDDLEFCTVHRDFESAACVESFDVNAPALRDLSNDRLWQWLDYMGYLHGEAILEMKRRAFRPEPHNSGRTEGVNPELTEESLGGIGG